MTRDERKAGLTFAEKLKELTGLAPDGYCRRDLNRAIATIQKRYGLSDEEKKKLIVKAIVNGAATVRDIEDETGIPAPIVAELVLQLEQAAQVKRQAMKIKEGKGRPSYFYVAVGNSPLYA